PTVPSPPSLPDALPLWARARRGRVVDRLPGARAARGPSAVPRALDGGDAGGGHRAGRRAPGPPGVAPRACRHAGAHPGRHARPRALGAASTRIVLRRDRAVVRRLRLVVTRARVRRRTRPTPVGWASALR